jgi:hypothetical protein
MGGKGANDAQASGKLNDSSPAANLASVNIKGKWAVVPFPRADSCIRDRVEIGR